VTFTEFVPLAIKTETKARPLNLDIIDLGLTDRILHAFLGLATEIDEYNLAKRKLDKVNALEELGDMLWYLAVLKDELDFNTYRMKELDMEFDMTGLDLVKKTIFYGKELDINKIKICCEILYNQVLNHIGVLNGDSEVIMDTIVAKLKARYGDKFSNEDADNRDLDTERAILEGGMR
jgi:NTP pyrophosphatase (non-canonical NTP hydrolase)